MASHFHPLQVNDVRRETDSCISLSFAIPPALQTQFTFIQGQNITLKALINGEEHRRSYSICSSPLDHELRIAIKKVDRGIFSGWAHHNIKKGDVLEVMPPAGKFHTPLHQQHRKNYVAFAAGSGITPLLSIIKTTLATEPNSFFTLVYGNRDRNSIIFKEALEAIKNQYIERFTLHHVLSREKTELPFNEGRIDSEKCDILFTHLVPLEKCDEFFICGPEAMVTNISSFLRNKQVAEENIHTELFFVPGIVSNQLINPDKEGEPILNDNFSEVSIKTDGSTSVVQLSYAGDSILDAALKAGIDLPFACKGGVCATCRAKLTYGQVAMDHHYALAPDEINEGYILTCQSHPRSPQVSVDFDER